MNLNGHFCTGLTGTRNGVTLSWINQRCVWRLAVHDTLDRATFIASCVSLGDGNLCSMRNFGFCGNGPLVVFINCAGQRHFGITVCYGDCCAQLARPRDFGAIRWEDSRWKRNFCVH